MSLLVNRPLDDDMETIPALLGTEWAAGDGVLAFDASADKWKLMNLGGGGSNTIAPAIYVATVTVANGATTGKESAIGIPAHFHPQCMAIHCTTAATNACSLVDVGDDADTDSFCDGIVTNDLTSTGFKGIVGCNGVRGLGDITGGVQVAMATPDEIEIVVSADPGATGVTLRLTFRGFIAG